MTAQNLIDTPPRLQYISQDIVGIKLEPIVALSSLRQVGVEVALVGEEESSIYARQRDGRFGMIFNRTWAHPTIRTPL